MSRSSPLQLLRAGLALAGAAACGVFFTDCVEANCLDASGNPVAWHFTYKMPDGYNYAYVDANSESNRASYLQVVGSLDDEANPPALIRTLRSLASSEVFEKTRLNQTFGAKASSGAEYFLYNDEPANGPKADNTYGHTKGVVATGGGGVSPFWLLHSTPRFPSATGSSAFYFPSDEIIYGQTFLCVTLSHSDLDAVATQLLYTRPKIYVNKVTSATSTPNLVKLFGNKAWERGTGDSGTSVHDFYVGGVTFRHFAKNSEWDSDIYEDLIAKDLESDLITETWMRGDELGPYCKSKGYAYDVLDIGTLTSYDVSKGANYTWTETHDHSKWALTQDSGSPYTCIADINRMSSQRKRGGGAFCFKNAGIASQLFRSVTAMKDNC